MGYLDQQEAFDNIEELLDNLSDEKETFIEQWDEICEVVASFDTEIKKKLVERLRDNDNFWAKEVIELCD